MKKSLFIVSALLTYSLANAANYYWVGGTGYYSDTLHWATTSGGSTFYSAPPAGYDDVTFDVNSFPSANDTVYFDSSYPSAHILTIAGVMNNPTFTDAPGATSISIQGNFTISSLVNWTSSVEMDIGAYPDSFIYISTNGTNISNNVTLLGDASGAVVLSDNFQCHTLDLETGYFITQNYNVTSDAYTFRNVNAELGSSTITSTNVMDFLNSGPVYGDSATFISPNFNVQTGIGGLNFGIVIAPYVSAEDCFFKEINSPSLTGLGNTVDLFTNDTIMVSPYVTSVIPNYFKKIIASNVIGIQGNATADTIIFTQPGAQLGLPDTLTITGDLIMNNTPSEMGSITFSSGDSCHLNKTSGALCFDFVTLSQVHAIGGAQFYAGYNSLDNGGNSGFQFTGCVTAGGVWPGDANYDLAVNNLDILAIGIAHGATGPTRGGASLAWMEQPATDWADTFVTGVNFKHADCDGNGIVEDADTAAVIANYGLHHSAARLMPSPLNLNSNSSLTINVAQDSVGPSSPVHVDVALTSDSIYGIAFSVSYNPSLINPASLVPDFSNSWLGTAGVNMIAFSKIDPVEGRIDFALTRTDHTDATGSGNLVSFNLVTADNIPSGTSLTMTADNVNGIFLSQNYEAITGGTDSTVVDSTVSVPTAELFFQDLNATLSNNKLDLTFSSIGNGKASLMLTDNTGRFILRQNISFSTGMNRLEIKTNDLAEGVYFISLMGNNFVKNIKVIAR